MRDTFLNFSSPVLGPEEREDVDAVLRSQWITTGPQVRRFEEEFAERVGAPHALALSSCTAGLHVALAALGVGPGDEVITTPMTFCATANVVEQVGARPVLVDIDPVTLQIDPAGVEAAMTPATRVLLPVHYTGHPCDMDALCGLARGRGVRVVEDAAHALPARYGGRTVGSIGDLTAFSFYATKNLTTAEGGMLTGSDGELLERARGWSLHGMSRDAWKRYEQGGGWRYEVLFPGFKYNMTDLQAALGLRQLARLDGFQRRREAIVARYHEAFGGHDSLQIPVTGPNVEHAWHLYVLRIVPGTLRIGRDRFIDELAARNIGTGVHFIPVHVHPYYRDRYGWRPEDFPVAHDAFERMLSIPLHAGLTDRDVEDVIEAVLDVARVHRR
jgi:dTDP-4-amino-4,6-dideoxygalactose transaminase